MCKIQYNFYSKMRLVGLIHITLKIIINQPPLKSVLRRMRVVELRVAVVSCELRVASCELRVASCELRVASCKLQLPVASYKQTK